MRDLCIVVPCYNEEAVLELSSARLVALLTRLIASDVVGRGSHILFVDDGSRDTTWKMIEALASSSDLVEGLKLSRNHGHQRAVLAGLLEARGDLLVSIDADLQDDLDVIEEMIECAENGAEIVYGVRSRRVRDTAFKRLTAEAFYRFMRKLGVETIVNHADFRLMSRRAVETFRRFGEVNLFLRGMMPMLGFKTAIVQYERMERLAGESKYTLSMMLALALEGVTSLSIRPLRVITLAGLFIALLSVLAGLWAVSLALTGASVLGWASIVVAIFFLGGLQLAALGVIGEYVGKTYMEAKQRPRYIIDINTEKMRSEPVAVSHSNRVTLSKKAIDEHA
jgi:glycosyltransferase involved in cell wall biosynthesis